MSPISACKTQRSGFQSTEKEEKLRAVAVVLYLLLFALLITSCGLPAQSATSASVGTGKASSSPTVTTNGGSHITVSGNMPNGTTQSPYNTVVSVSGGSNPYQFSTLWGALPPGLTLNATTGTISGTPVQSGTYNFSVAATDLPRNDSGDHRFTIVVAQGSQSNISVTISPTSATVSAGGTQQFSATVSGSGNVAVHWKTTAGSISTNGLLSVPATGVTSLTVTAMSIADPTKTASSAVTVTSGGGGNGNPTITTTSVPDATSGDPYSTTLSATGGTTPYTWSISSGSLPSGLTMSSSTGAITGTTSKTGTFSFTAKVTDSTSKTGTAPLSLNVSSQNSGGFDGPAELPRTYIQSALANTPAPGKTIVVASGGDFQGALNNASCGDTITLQSGATYNGIFTAPAKGCDDSHWIIVRTSAADSALPAEGTRMTPCYAGVSSLPGRPALNCKSTTNVLAKINMNSTGTGPLTFASGATHYRFLGLEITRSTGIGIVYSLASVPSGSTADHIYFDRVWMHGNALEETNRAIMLSGMTYVAAVDSFFTDFHCIANTGSCTDAQVIAGGTGDSAQGPYKINHNFMEAAAQAMILGGSEATITPADIEVRYNHMFKPLTWLAGQPGYIGVSFVVKNHFELKNAQRVLFEGNIMENTWGGFSQSGFSLLLTPKNQSSGSSNICPLCQVTDVTVRYNTASHAGSGIQVANGLSDSGGAPLDGQRYSIHDNVLDDIDPVKYAGNGLFAQVSMGDGTPLLQNVSIVHNTGFAPDQTLSVGDDTNVNPKMVNFTFNNNMMNAGLYPVWSTGGTHNCAISDKPSTVLATCFSGWFFTNNAMIAIPNNSPQAVWPAGNFFPTDTTAVQFVKYNNGNGGDYHLLASSPYKNAGTDGKDVGADIDAILAATKNVY
jgi:hypothetical protein